MEFLDNLITGFATAFTLANLGYVAIGCLIGTLIGVLPGLGPLATISILLPFTFGLPPIGALIMLAGIYYGSQYGGSTTAILVNLPGETSSVVTLLDGHEMAKRGRAGVALATAAIGSFVAGCIGTLMIASFAVPLTAVALTFGGAEYFSLMVLGLLAAVFLSSGSIFKSLAMICVGMIIGVVGTDVTSGAHRFTFGLSQLWDGIDFVVVAVALFAVSEIVSNLEGKQVKGVVSAHISSLWPTREDLRRIAPAILRGTGLGLAIGVLPGAGPSIASFMSYTLERKSSRNPDEFGKGAIEGVAGPEAANNAAAQASFIPTLALGVPGSASMALMLGAMMIHNIQPGPQVIAENPTLFWGLIASMWIGNVALLVLNLPLVGLWVQLLKIRYSLLYPAILVFSCIGVYSIDNSVFPIYLMAGFGILGYLFRKLDCNPAPLLLGLVLGPIIEVQFRRAMIISRGSFDIFIERPISLALLLTAAALIGMAIYSVLKDRIRARTTQT